MRTLLAALAAAFCLTTPAHAQAGRDDPAIGVYAFSGGREAYIEYLPDIDGLAMVEFPSGRVRPLARDGDGAFTFGPSIGAAAPVEARLTLRGDRLTWSEDGDTRRARRIAFRTEDVTIASGDVRLAGTLTLPRGRGPFPAFVLLHGGGAQSRDFFWVTHFLARRGFAVLAYDKRGVGGSTGDWRSATVHDLADDARAAVAWLRARDDIRADRVGLYGASAGGWTAPLAASQAPDSIAFIVVRSASALPERQNVIFEMENDLRAAGHSEEVVAQARALHERDIAVIAANGAGWEDLRSALQTASGEPWFELARMPRDLIPQTPENAERIAAHVAREQHNTINPSVLWAGLDMPILVQIGGRDRYVPGDSSAAAIAAAVARNRRAEVILYPTGDHPMFENESGFGRDIPNVRRYTENYLTDLDRFVRDLR